MKKTVKIIAASHMTPDMVIRVFPNKEAVKTKVEERTVKK